MPSSTSTQSPQQAGVLWLTGLSGAGKSTLVQLVEQELLARGCNTHLLDGDVIRMGLCKDLGFSVADRYENIRRVADMAKALSNEGLLVLCATISPFQRMRNDARKIFPAEKFIEVFVDAPLSICEARDPKGLYRKARAGEITQFTGIDSAYEPPHTPEIHLRTDTMSPQICTKIIIEYLQNHGFIAQSKNSELS